MTGEGLHSEGSALAAPSRLERVTGIEPALSAWELDGHASLATASQFKRQLRLSLTAHQVPLLTVPTGTQRARCQVRDRP